MVLRGGAEVTGPGRLALCGAGRGEWARARLSLVMPMKLFEFEFESQADTEGLTGVGWGGGGGRGERPVQRNGEGWRGDDSDCDAANERVRPEWTEQG